MLDDPTLSSWLRARRASSHNRARLRSLTILSRRTPRLLPCIALGLALFLAQAAALVHATDHAGSAKSGLHSQLCDACLSFSTIFSMAGGPSASPVLPALVVAFPIDVADASLVDRVTPRAFQSRAPPRR
jgi:hypothetical protein